METPTLMEVERGSVFQTYKRQPVLFTRGEGCYLYDEEGNRYLDLVAGVAVMALGHSHPDWVKAVQEQAASLVHVSNLFYTKPMIELAKDLCSLSGMDSVFFCNSGAEANETAIKVARKWGKQKRGASCFRILTFEKAFHGRTCGALSATAQRNYCEPFEPLLPGFTQLPRKDLQQLSAAVDETVCAVMIEPIQGEGGVLPFDAQWLTAVRRLCDEKNVLLIIDEVQTGIGRTGTWFGFQHSGVLPDLAPLAKGLGGGFPIGACLARGEAAKTMGPGDHGSTFAGSPLAATAALTVLRVLREQKVLEHVQIAGRLFQRLLDALCSKHPVLDHVRGAGLMLGLEFRQPIARTIVTKGLERGLLLNATSDTTLRFVPPLIIGENEIQEATNVLDAILTEYKKASEEEVAAARS